MDDNWAAPDGTQHFIGNRWVASNEGQTIDVVDPSDGKPFARIARGDGADIDRAVRAARNALGESFDGDWGRLTATERGRLLMKLSAAVLDRHEQLAQLEHRPRAGQAADVDLPHRQRRRPAARHQPGPGQPAVRGSG